MKKYTIWTLAAIVLVSAVLFGLLGCSATGNKDDGTEVTPAATEATQPAEAPTELAVTVEPEETEEVTMPTEEDQVYEEPEFVPSVTYKGGPGVPKAILEEKDVTSCVAITTVEDAQDKKTDIMQEERDRLVELYQELVDGTMVLPIEGEHVIQDFVDVSFLYEGCRLQESHNDKAGRLAEENVVLTVEFDYNISMTAEFVVLVYVNEEWVKVPATNDGEGHILCEFEDIGPVAFVILK